MKQSIINNYLKALNSIVNDSRISFVITGNFADRCNIVIYWCKNQVLYSFTLFNDSSIINCDNLIDVYLAIMAKHPTKQGEKQLFSLRYDSMGYCSLAITDSSNLELHGTTHKRISKQLAKVLYNYVTYKAQDDFISCYTDKYTTSYNYRQTLMFKL